MPSRLAELRESRSWFFDQCVFVAGLSVFAWATVAALLDGRAWVLPALVCVPLIVVIARFPIVLDRGDGGIEIGFDSSMLIFLLCTLDAHDALVIWCLGTVLTQLLSGKRLVAKIFNSGVGTLGGGAAAAAIHLVRGTELGTPLELLAVILGAACYFFVDYVATAVSVSIDAASSVRAQLLQRGTLVAIACFVPFDLLGYLGAVVWRLAPWWTLILLGIPVVTLLIATRAVTRASENARRLSVLLDAAVRAQTLYEPYQVVDALLEDARALLRMPNVELRPVAPTPEEIGARVHHGKDATWIVAPAQHRARSTTAADQQALEAMAAVFSDAFARIQLTEDMVHFARHDQLTDLPNRGILLDRVVRALEDARREQTRVSLLFIDLDGFKPVNDRFGHAAGDNVLIAVGQRLRECVRDEDTVARLGGDEFAVLLEDIEAADVDHACERILAMLYEGVYVAGHHMRLHASIGIATGDGLESAESMLRHADLAMYEAKSRGKAQFVTYDPKIGRSRLERLELVEELRAAVANGDIDVVYQPLIEVDTRKIVGVEALSRWRNGDVDVPPDVFIRIAEETGLIVPLGEMVLARAVADSVSLREVAGGPVKMAVNVSAGQLRESSFVDVVRRAQTAMGAGSSDLVLELTEREGIGHDPVVLEAMHTIADTGVTFAIDDFGVGFSSISYLQDLPVKIIKVDATLAKNIDSDPRSCALIRSVALMAEALGLDVVVEGVERESQLDVVRDVVHAQFAQGFLMHRPMRLPDVLAALRTNRGSGLMVGQPEATLSTTA